MHDHMHSSELITGVGVDFVRVDFMKVDIVSVDLAKVDLAKVDLVCTYTILSMARLICV